MIASIILPALNEEGAIGQVIESIRATGLDLQIIVIDDGSTDRTGEIAHSMGAQVIRHPLSLGAGQSVKDGVMQASSERIIMLDADGTYPADYIPVFLSKLDEGFDLVVGARHGKEYRGSMLKYAARFVFRMIAQFATGKSIPDINSGMRAFRKSALVSYYPHLCNGFSLPTTMTLAYFFTGRMVAYVPIPYYKRIGVSKVRIIRDSMRTLQYITESILYFNPIKLFLLLASIVLATGILAGIVVGSLYLFFTSVFFALLVFSLGLVAHTRSRG